MNFGHGITIATVLFIFFILTFVYRSYHQNFDFVTENYYEKEIVYQGRINQMENTKKLEHDIKWAKTEKGIEIQFPQIEYNAVIGILKMMRPADKKMDISMPIILSSEGKQIVKNEALVKGKYELQIEWELNNIKYYYQSIVII